MNRRIERQNIASRNGSLGDAPRHGGEGTTRSRLGQVEVCDMRDSVQAGRGRAGLAMLLFSLTLLLGGCTRDPINSYFVSRRSQNQVIMMHLVESPPGTLTGIIATRALAQDSDDLRSSQFSVSGTITGDNVRLEIAGALAEIARFFGGDMTLIGTLRGSVLTLSRGTNTFVLYESSRESYIHRLNRLEHIQANLNEARRAHATVDGSIAYAKQVDTALDRYHSWGELRIVRQPKVKQWWERRIHGYTACVNHVRTLAADRMPSWRWQNCVIAIENDAYFRNSALQNVQSMVDGNRKEIARLNSMIATARSKAIVAGEQMKHTCAHAVRKKECFSYWRKWMRSENSIVDPAKVAAFRGFAPQVTGALSADLAVATHSHATLVSLAGTARRIYNTATER